MAFQTRLTPQLIDRYTRSGEWGAETFFELLSAVAASDPGREAVVDACTRVSYGQLVDRLRRTAALLRAHGIGPGDVVTIQLPNRVDFLYVFFALELLGAIANPINPDFRTSEVEFILRFTESRVYVCAREFKSFDYVAMARSLAPRLPGLRLILVAEGPGDGPTLLSLAESLARFDPLPISERVRMDANAVMRMAFTSGTTGNPKGVLHSFNTTLPPCRFLTRDMKATQNDVFLLYLPIGLNWGYLVLVQALMLGARAVLQERFSGRGALELIERERVTFIPTAPASLVAMLNEPDRGKFDLSSLRIVITGGATCPVETLKAFQQSMSGHLIELYGMLETGYHTYTRLEDDPRIVNGTIGRSVEGMGLRLLDEAGQDVPPGAIGEIACDGPAVHLGYHKNPQANAEAFTSDGWFRTGDLGQVADGQGNIRIAGRRKEIINRGGKKFFPREIEELLYAHPKVLHAAMIGIPDPRLGERNCLCVVPRAGEQPVLEEFLAFLRDRVATYKLPERLELFDDLPRTPTGKLQRFVLADLVRQRMTADKAAS